MVAAVPSNLIEVITASEDLVHIIASHVSQSRVPDAWSRSPPSLTCAQLPSRAALRALCLVSRWFNYVFSQFLYSHILFHDGNAHILRDPELLQVLITNPRVARVKVLSFRLIEGSWAIGNRREVGRLVDAPGYGWTGDTRHWAGVYNASITKLVLMAPNIYRFE